VATFRFDCEKCGKELSIQSDYVGRKAKCPVCGGTFVISDLQASKCPSPPLHSVVCKVPPLLSANPHQPQTAAVVALALTVEGTTNRLRAIQQQVRVTLGPKEFHQWRGGGADSAPKDDSANPFQFAFNLLQRIPQCANPTEVAALLRKVEKFAQQRGQRLVKQHNLRHTGEIAMNRIKRGQVPYVNPYR